MSLTDYKIGIASAIHTRMQQPDISSTDDASTFAEMLEFLPDYKWLVFVAEPGDMNELAARYAGFARYAKVLQNIAAGAGRTEKLQPH